ncbi:MAG TPA: hypothetical protein PKD26_08390 [Pyrinomonadaceae bacterium]|nr:hypothetical protein [Pyrinomonadaceae bacterium]
MRAITQPHPLCTEIADRRGFVFDTTLVLFFLAFDGGMRFSFGIDGMMSAATLIIFLVFPYFLPYNGEKPAFERWVMGRAVVASFGILLGILFKQAVGVLLPEMFRFVPLALLIVAGAYSALVQFYSIFRFRLAK